MQNEVQSQVCSTFMEVVEKLTFMFGEVVDKSEVDSPGMPFTLASMSFTGDVKGVLSVAVPTEMTAEIAANILGLDPEDVQPDEMMNDALAEMLNVVCGHVIMALVGTGANFKLDSPLTCPVDEMTYQAMLESDDFAGMMLDDSPVFLGLKLEN
jgi:CheY-specific phosphatase CheX